MTQSESAHCITTKQELCHAWLERMKNDKRIFLLGELAETVKSATPRCGEACCSGDSLDCALNLAMRAESYLGLYYRFF